MNPYALAAAAIGGVVLAVVLALGGYKAGAAVVQSKWNEAELARAEKIIVRERVIAKEVPKIVVQTVEREKVVEKEVERVVTVIPKILAPDCVLPDGFGMLLVSAANGVDPTAPGAPNAFSGGYDCRATLAAILTDLEAGWQNSARLHGLQEWAAVVSKGP